jgi:hypothetical protein
MSALSCLPYKGLIVVSMSSIHALFNAACTLDSKLRGEPVLTLLCTYALLDAAQGVFTDQAAHAQHLRAERIAAQTSDVGIALFNL